MALLQAFALAVRLSAFTDPDTAIANAFAAVSASDSSAPAEVLLAIAWHESRFDPSATSYLEDGRRRGGRWRSAKPAGSGPRFCGVMQTTAGKDWSACVAQRPLVSGYAAGASILRAWRRAARGELAPALRGYGCGFAGMRDGCRRFDTRVIAHARMLGWRSP